MCSSPAESIGQCGPQSLGCAPFAKVRILVAKGRAWNEASERNEAVEVAPAIASREDLETAPPLLSSPYRSPLARAGRDFSTVEAGGRALPSMRTAASQTFSRRDPIVFPVESSVVLPGRLTHVLFGPSRNLSINLSTRRSDEILYVPASTACFSFARRADLSSEPGGSTSVLGAEGESPFCCRRRSVRISAPSESINQLITVTVYLFMRERSARRQIG